MTIQHPENVATQVESDCIEWPGQLDKDGYGQVTRRAHRIAYLEQVGPIPDGMQIDHLCRNRACVNVDHLEPVTPRENLMRSPIAPAAINARKTHCNHGHEFTFENTRAQPGGRACRTCGNEAQARFRARKKAQA